MKSAAVVFVEMFNISSNRMRPAKLEGLLVSLLHTINKHGFLDEAIEDIESLIGFDVVNPEGLAYIKAVTKTPELVGLYKQEKAIKLLVKLQPSIAVCEGHTMVTLELSEVTEIVNRSNKSHVYSELKKILGHINSLEVGFKIVQKPRDSLLNEFHIVKYSSREELLGLLLEHGLQNPSVLDKVMR